VTDSLPDRLEAEKVGVAGVELSSMVSKRSVLHTVVARHGLTELEPTLTIMFDTEAPTSIGIVWLTEIDIVLRES